MSYTSTYSRKWNEQELTELLLFKAGKEDTEGDVAIYHTKDGGVELQVIEVEEG